MRSINALLFHSLTKLEYLNLAENLLISLEAAAFHGVERLQFLNLSSNNLHPNGLSDGGLYGLNYLKHLLVFLIE